MVSICVPVYNFNLNKLIHDLSRQVEAARVEYEIIVIDDASQPAFKQANEFLNSHKKVVYIELQQNIGRSAIRNKFLEFTRFEKLLFLDCDTEIYHNQFINNYLNPELIKEKVICGGRIYSSRPQKAKYLLRWKYGIYRECKLAKERKENPWHSFMTNNFLIDKDVLQNIRFDTRLKGYGHEDSLFGYHLKLNNIPIKNIDNQTIHDFNESAVEFLRKTREGIRNLFFINSVLIPNGEFYSMNQLLKTFKRVRRFGGIYPLGIISIPSMPMLALFFRLGMVYLWCFDLYKLLYMCRLALTEKSLLKSV